MAIANHYPVAADSDNALDQSSAIPRRIENDDITSTHRITVDHVDVREWNAKAISALVDEYAITGERREFHRSGRHIIVICKRRPGCEYADNQQSKKDPFAQDTLGACCRFRYHCFSIRWRWI